MQEQEEYLDDFAADLQPRIKEAAEIGRRYDEEVERFQTGVQARLLQLQADLQRRFVQAVQLSEGNLRMQTVEVDDATGDRTYSLLWVGPGIKRGLHIIINPPEMTLQYRWTAAWNQEGTTYTIKPERARTFNIQRVIVQLIEPQTWIDGRFPSALV